VLKYSDVENLPEDHQLVKQFMKEQELLDEMYDEAHSMDDEASYDYFNHYIAGDKK